MFSLGTKRTSPYIFGNTNKVTQDHQEIYQASKDKGVTDTAPASLGKENLPNSSIPFFTPTLNASAPPKVYRISHDSELIMLGQRAHWMFVKDESNMHLLYAMHVLWQDDVPITAGLLRRASELLPACGAVYTKILRTPGGAYRLQMETTSQVLTTETPDRGQFTKVWSPRRFTYGGRNFVWEAQKDGGPWSKFEWETLYETQSVSKKEGSKTGKMEDVKVGQKLCWGEKTGTKIGGKRVEHTIYISAGLDQIFTEHLLASQLSRYVKTQYPASKDPGGVENAITAGSGLFAFAIAVSGVV